jgi:hypothetical protein
VQGVIELDAAGWPVLHIRYKGTVDAEAFEAHLEELAGHLARGERYGVVFDARRAEHLPALQRKMQADWVAAHRAALTERCVGVAFVFDSSVVRGLLTAILWVQPLPHPHCVVPTLAEAEAWVREALAHPER